MQYEFPDNLNSSLKNIQERSGTDWYSEAKFLHYKPRNEQFGKKEQQIASTIKLIENQYQVFLLITQQKVSEMIDQLLGDERQTLNIIPKKANIDLKRYIQPKLDKLNHRTERAIATLLNSQYQKVVKVTDAVVPKQEMEDLQNTNIYDKNIEFDSDISDTD